MERITGCQPFIINSQTKQEFCLTIKSYLTLVRDKSFHRQMELLSSLDSQIWSSSICFFFSGLYFKWIYTSSLKVIAKLKLIYQSSFCKGGMFTNDPRAHFWPQILGNLGGFCKVRAIRPLWLLWTSKNDFLWPLGQSILSQIRHLIKINLHRTIF